MNAHHLTFDNNMIKKMDPNYQFEIQKKKNKKKYDDDLRYMRSKYYKIKNKY